jgi:uncharacterized protein YbbC (DUF1343 family)
MVVTGLQKVLDDPLLLTGCGRLGLLYNQASVDSNYRSAPTLISEAFPDRLKALFGPQHGVWLTEQDNMIETSHTTHSTLGLPIYSLYSDSRRPTEEMLESIDTLVVDLQDVGTRVYTFASTVAYFIEECSFHGKQVVVLDRPNPINGVDVEGNILQPELSSFVGPYPIPMRHGMTMGELMKYYNEYHGIGCNLDIVTLSNWSRNSFFDDCGLPWVMPSPNMPSLETAVVYPGQVILEGTNLSEGRGTTKPFEIFGAPYLDPYLILAELEVGAAIGATMRPLHFRPTFGKWAGQVCKGFQIHVTDRKLFRPYHTSLAIISTIFKLYPENFQWADPPYEYVSDKLPIDVILGDMTVRLGVEQNRPIGDMEDSRLKASDNFMRNRERFLLYE